MHTIALILAVPFLAVAGYGAFGAFAGAARPAAGLLSRGPVPSGVLAAMAVEAAWPCRAPLQVPTPRLPQPGVEEATEILVPAPRPAADTIALGPAAREVVETAADAAFTAAIGRSHAYILAIRDEIGRITPHGRPGLLVALGVWARNWEALSVLDPFDDTIPAIYFVNPDGSCGDPTEADAGELWANQWLAAHAADDHATVAELAVSVDDVTLQARALTVLFTATASGSMLRPA